MKISKLTTADLDAIDDLMKQNSHTLGFLTRETIRSHLEKECVLGAKTDNDALAGYLLYAAYPDRFRLVHLCVEKNFRDQGIAKLLLENLKNSATTQKVIKLNCRRNFPAHDIWPKLGFVPLDERLGRSSAGHHLALWVFTLAPDDQLSLFQAKTSDETLDVIIDSQIFFDLYEPDSDKTKPSKALLSDFLVDSINLWITDEMFVEIDRHKDTGQRARSRQRAQDFFPVMPDPHLVENFDSLLRTLLPSRTSSQESDIRQLAKAAASDVKTFVTRDQALLNKKEKINELTNLRVLFPTELIIQLHELSEEQSYKPARVSGLSLVWSRMTSNDLALFPLSNFLNQDERKGPFREKLNRFLARPDQYECEILRSGNEIVAIRVLTSSCNETLTALLARVARSADQSLFGRFLIADTIFKAVDKELIMVNFEPTSPTLRLKPDLLEMGFTECNDGFVRFCFARCLDRRDVLSEISELSPEAASKHQEMSEIELEKSCSPLSLKAINQKYFLAPIRPGYAMGLFDQHQSADDLFGGNINVLLRWNNVYYRRKTHHKILKSPARILWYVSGNKKQIVAVSHLDEVEIGAAKALFKKFKKFGILEWNDIYKMCAGDPSKKIMALKFSHTFPFRKPVSLDTIRAAFKENGTGLSLQSPLKLSTKIFHKLFQLGYPN